MCGIIALLTQTSDVRQKLLEGLQMLQNRGYDSAGLAVINTDKKLQRLRSEGKVRKLERSLTESDLRGTTGI